MIQMKDNHVDKNKKSPKKYKLIIIFLVVGIIIGSILLIYGTNSVLKRKKPLSYDEAKEKSEELADNQERKNKEEEIIKKVTNEEPTVVEEAKEQNKTDLYKEYEKLPKEDKKEIDVVPREEEVPIEVIDDIIQEQEMVEIPRSFSLKDVIDIQVEDQGQRGLCWDFAALKSVETFIALKEGKTYDFSEQHVNYITSNLLYGDRVIDDGGNFANFERYLLQSGVVAESDVPYDKDYGEEEYSKFIDMEPIKIVADTVNFPTINKDQEINEEELNKFRETIKRHIMQNGSVFASIYSFGNTDASDKRNYYVSTKTTTNKLPNHAISIVGWDDDYSRENFKDGEYIPEHDGAYIALNSWGTNSYFDENGNNTAYFYISYEDAYVEIGMSGITSVDLDDSNAIALDDIKSKSIKKEIIGKFNYAIKEDNSKKYATKLLMKQINSISLDNEEFSMNDIKFLTSLLNLEIKNSDINSIDELPVMNNLYEIDLENTKVENVDVLTNFPNLKIAYLNDNKIKDVSNLTNLNVYVLNLSGNKDVKGYGKVNVQYSLNLSNCNISELEPLETIPQAIMISDNKFENFHSIPATVNSLNISNNNIQSLEGINKFTSLAVLNISKNKIEDFTPLSELVNINKDTENIGTTGLQLTYEESDLSDITKFNDLNISKLILSGNNLTSLNGFKPGEKLSGLILSNNSITELGDFVPNENLNNLSLDNNKIKDISSLEPRNLESLTLNGNYGITGYGGLTIPALFISDCGIEKLEPINDKVTYLDVSKNKIKDISTLSDAKSLITLSLNDNKESLTGTLENDSLYDLYITNTELTDDFKLKCSNLDFVSTSKLDFPADNVGNIYIYDVELTDEIAKNLESNKYLVSPHMTISVKAKDKKVSLDEIPYMSFKTLSTSFNDDAVTISKDRKYMLLLKDVDKVEMPYAQMHIYDRYFSGTVTLKINKSGSILDGIKWLANN